MKVKIRTILSLVILAASAHAVAAQQGTVMNWTIDGVKREALVFAPKPANNDIRHPVVFAWHGHGGNMQGASQSMHIQTLWPEAIVVYPQGLISPRPKDPPGNTTGWQYEANQTRGNVGNRDLDFFDAMVATMKQTYTVDEKRIYATGFSLGGVFSYLLWAERSKTIAAIGEVAGRLWDTENLSDARAILAIAGQKDTTDPYADQLQSIEKAKQADSATGPGQPCGPHCIVYASTTQTPVKTILHLGAHVYPPWAPAEIVKFLKAHHL